MPKQTNVYVFSHECKKLLDQPMQGGYGLIYRVARKISLVQKGIHQQESRAIAQGAWMTKRLLRYCDDISSEIKKYQSVLKNPDVLRETRRMLTARCYSLASYHALSKKLTEAILLTDTLHLLWIAAKKQGVFEEESTILSLQSKLKKKLFRLLGSLNSRSITLVQHTRQAIPSLVREEKNHCVSHYST